MTPHPLERAGVRPEPTRRSDVSNSTPRPWRVDYEGLYRRRATSHATKESADRAIEQFLDGDESRDPSAFLTEYTGSGTATRSVRKFLYAREGARVFIECEYDKENPDAETSGYFRWNGEAWEALQ